MLNDRRQYMIARDADGQFQDNEGEATDSERNPFSSISSDDELCKIIWVVRDLTLANFVIPYVANLLSLQKGGTPLVLVEIFLTGGGSKGTVIDTMALNALLLYHFGECGRATNNMIITLGRPNLEEELKTAKGTAAFYCGGPGLLRRLEVACSKTNVVLHPEEFQNRTLSQWPSCAPSSCCTTNPKSSSPAQKGKDGKKGGGKGKEPGKDPQAAFQRLLEIQIEKTSEVTNQMMLMKKEFTEKMDSLTAHISTPMSAQRHQSRQVDWDAEQVVDIVRSPPTMGILPIPERDERAESSIGEIATSPIIVSPRMVSLRNSRGDRASPSATTRQVSFCEPRRQSSSKLPARQIIRQMSSSIGFPPLVLGTDRTDMQHNLVTSVLHAATGGSGKDIGGSGAGEMLNSSTNSLQVAFPVFGGNGSGGDLKSSTV